MLRQTKNTKNKGQSLVEYALLLGTITLILMTMNPFVKRTLQSMIKLTADQIGVQNAADQNFNAEQGGFLESSYSATRVGVGKTTTDSFGEVTYEYDDFQGVTTCSVTNMGFTEQ